jgi:hypothetical protein
MPSAFTQFAGSAPGDSTVTPSKIASTFGGFFRNKLINPDFAVATNGTSFSTPANGATTLDGWLVSYNGTIGSFTVSQQAHTIGQTTVPDEPQYFIRWNHSSAGSGSTFRRLEQRISGVRVLAGKSASLTIYAKADSSRNASVDIVQNFGSGGSSDVVTSGGTIALTTSWQKFTINVVVPSISGKTLGSGNYIAVRLGLPINATMTIDFSHFQFEENGATPFEQRPLFVEDLLCLGLSGATFDQLAPTTTAGDLITHNGVTNIRFALGSALQELRVNAGATGLEYFTPTAAFANDIVIVADQKAQNTAGGTFTSGAWQTRVINTEIADTGNNCTIASNQITLLAGTYRFLIVAPAFEVDRHQARLQNITDAATVALGTCCYAPAAYNGHTLSVIQGRVTIAATKTFEIQHQCGATMATSGFGLENNFSTEVYTSAIFWKE